jgi:hypothetical protein
VHDPDAHSAADAAPHGRDRIARGFRGCQGVASFHDQRLAGTRGCTLCVVRSNSRAPSSRSKLRTDTDSADWTR